MLVIQSWIGIWTFLSIPRALPATFLVVQPFLAGCQSRQLLLVMNRVCYGEGAKNGEQVGSSRCGIIGPPGETQGAGAARGGGEVVIVLPALVGSGQKGNSCEPLGHPGLCSEVLRMPGLRHTARLLPWVPATLPGCHDNQHFHPCPFVWSWFSFCEQP